ncbi:MAG: hypothetical protein JWL95_130 [Gemmatimonadetes bacterium]|nr:hypothetical protein [Gemmatimonadota bacterium]
MRDDDAVLWMVALCACALAIAVWSGFAPLSDPDLPNHLAMGERIVAHRGVPRIEPFAWTREGAPFFAYSWLAELAMFTVLRMMGPFGLHLLAGAAGAGATLAAAAAARALGAKPASATAFGVASAIVALESTPFLRPQLFMHVVVPLAWVCTARIARSERTSAAPLFALMLVSAVAASVHITFPVVAVPLVLLALGPQPDRDRRLVMAGGAVIAGWLLSPYALAWPDVFRLNFAPNAITRYPAPTGELTPGFIVAPLIGTLLAALPLVALPRLPGARERTWYGLLWLVGLILFARMFKGLGPWWWCTMPMTVTVLSLLPTLSSTATRRVYALLLVACVAALGLPTLRLYGELSRFEGGVGRSTLPSLKGYAAEPAARWLELHMLHGATGRLLTSFNYGSYLEWRLPTLSVSVDGRTIFPDSAAMPDAISERGTVYEGPWMSSDVAIVPVTFPVAARLDADPRWRRIGVAAPAPWATAAPRAGLWVRRSWWQVARR